MYGKTPSNIQLLNKSLISEQIVVAENFKKSNDAFDYGVLLLTFKLFIPAKISDGVIGSKNKELWLS